MVFLGPLRSCWKHACGRILVLLFVLSLSGLVILPQLVSNNAVVKAMSVVLRNYGTENETTPKQLAEMHQLPDNNKPRLTHSTPPHQLPDNNKPRLTNSTPPHQLPDNNKPRLTNSTPPSLEAHGVRVTTAVTKTATAQNGNSTNQPLNVNNTAQKNSTTTGKRYLIYICDHKTYCYGIGDRQRGILSVYILAEVTNRTFGIIMTSPSDFTEFYKPNLVPWDIPKSELQGKSSFEILAYGPKVHLGLHEIDFNKVYPQDVVYVRTNHRWQLDLLKNHHYRDKFPQWAKVPTWKMFQVAWLRLMTPTTTLRQELNQILVHIAQDMNDEYYVWQNLNNTKCCENSYINMSNCSNKTCDASELQMLCCNQSNSNNSLHVSQTCVNGTCTNKSNITNCKNVTCPVANITHCNNTTCTNVTANTPESFERKDCLQHVEDTTTNVTVLSRLKPFATTYCEEKRPVLAPWMSVESIQKTQGYDKVNINLVCVHIRVGHSTTMPLENNVRNKPGTVTAVWEFLKPYVASGRHVYLATDSQEVRQQAKDVFGNRLHVSTVPIFHIALVRQKQDERSAFSLTLVEQLLLATSCKTLVISYSGFSMKAAQLRDQLPGGAWELYMFKNGGVGGKSVKWLLR